MTYIVTGRFNDNTFLMTDCVGTPQNDKHKFINKLVRLKSTTNETYSTITGYDTFQVAIILFDRKCFELDVMFDIENKKHICEIIEIYELLKNNSNFTKGIDVEKDFLFSELFFVEKDKICYYIIKKDDGNKMYIHEKKYVENNTVVEDAMTFVLKDEKYNNSNEIIEYCKTEIKKHYKQKEETSHIDLKDKFSYIIFSDNERLKKLPYNDNSEFILSEIGCNYEEI